MPVRPRVTILAVGKLRESFWRDAAAEYVKRLSGMTANLEIVEVGDEPNPEGASASEEATVRQREGARLLAKLPERAFVIVCDGSGEVHSSERLSAWIERLCAQDGVSEFAFVIGGSQGLSDPVRARADLLLSFGPMTFPHQLLRVMLLEQLYRALQISRGAPYHK